MSLHDRYSRPCQPMRYQIAVSGVVNASWSEWFDGLVLSAGVDAGGFAVTHLMGTIPDQGALRGILNRLWDLNLTLLSVECNQFNKEDVR